MDKLNPILPTIKTRPQTPYLLARSFEFAPFKINTDLRWMIAQSRTERRNAYAVRENGYRFAFNGQERTDEIKGLGNHNTALYWEYDTRLGRRWNIDPKYTASESRYATNGNNPIIYIDPNGDFKTKFGALLYQVVHGGSIEQGPSGQWAVSKNVKYDGEGPGVCTQTRYGWGGQNRPINYGSRNPMTPYDVGIDWLTGSGAREQKFGDGDPFTEIYRQHDHLRETENIVRSRLQQNSNGSIKGENPWQLNNFIEGLKYLKEVPAIASNGEIGNLAFAYLGSHNLTYNVTCVDIEQRIAEVQFEVTNCSNLESALRPPGIGYTYLWRNTVGKVLNSIVPTGPGSAVNQTIQWNQTIKY